jgi:pyruvate dehydrogenase E1 component
MSPYKDPLTLVEERVLRLATSIVHAANTGRPNTSGIKVGGHQASSASMVGIMTSLRFEHLTPFDRVSVKPHASPVLHAINYLLGNLDASYLPRLPELGGLQPYPSRTKDPDLPDYSTRSAGLGATAPVWGAIARRYASAHLGVEPGGPAGLADRGRRVGRGRQLGVRLRPRVQQLGEVLWIVDLNRQSLDRIVPDIAIQRWQSMFAAAAGWQVLEVKYGRLLQELFSQVGGQALRVCIDGMPNEEFQFLLPSPADSLRDRLAAGCLGGGGQQPTDSGLRLHRQGQGAADRGISVQPQRAAVRGAVRPARRHPWRKCRESLAGNGSRFKGGSPVQGGALHAGDAGPGADRPRPGRPGGSGADGDRQP